MKKGIGALTERVELQSPVYAEGTSGGETDKSHTAVGTVWAGIEPISMNGRFQNFAVGVNATHVVKLRRNDDIEVDWRLLWGTRYLYIRSEIIGNKAWRFFVCEEVM